MIFWCRRWMLHSRSNRATVLAVGVGQHLHLDVPGVGHVALEEDGAVAEGRRRLAPGARPRPRRRLDRPAHDPHAPPAPAGRGLDQQRPAQRLAPRRRRASRRRRRWRSTGGWARRPPRIISLAPIFEPMASMAAAGGPDPDEPGPDHRPGEVARLRQEPVAGWMASAAGPGGGVEDEVRAQVGVGRATPRAAARPGRPRPRGGCRRRRRSRRPPWRCPWPGRCA